MDSIFTQYFGEDNIVLGDEQYIQRINCLAGAIFDGSACKSSGKPQRVVCSMISKPSEEEFLFIDVGMAYDDGESVLYRPGFITKTEVYSVLGENPAKQPNLYIIKNDQIPYRKTIGNIRPGSQDVCYSMESIKVDEKFRIAKIDSAESKELINLLNSFSAIELQSEPIPEGNNPVPTRGDVV